MRYGLGLLALASLAGGLLVLTPLLDVDWRHVDVFFSIATLLLMGAAGLLVTRAAVGTPHGDAAARLPVRWRSKAARGLDLGTAYGLLVGRPVLALAHVVRGADARLDAGVDGLETGAIRLGRRLDRLHTRRPSDDLLAMAVGLVLIGTLAVALW